MLLPHVCFCTVIRYGKLNLFLVGNSSRTSWRWGRGWFCGSPLVLALNRS